MNSKDSGNLGIIMCPNFGIQFETLEENIILMWPLWIILEYIIRKRAYVLI